MELRRYVEYSGLTMSDIARELDTSPQNIRYKMTRERLENENSFLRSQVETLLAIVGQK